MLRFAESLRPMLVLANKCDKLSKGAAQESVALIRLTLELPEDTVVLPFSAEKGMGREELLGEMFRRI